MSHSGTPPHEVGFFERPAIWKAFVVVAGYLVVYLAIGLLVGLLADADIEMSEFIDSPRNILLALVIPIGTAALLFLWFLARIGWLRAVFGPQPIRGPWWTWLAPILIVVAIVLHLADTDFGAYPVRSLLLLAVMGVFLGIAEETVARGFAVKMIRDAGHSEWVVMAVSSLIFSLMHATNVLSGQSVGTTLVQMGFTFGFGICMYLTLRATGSLVWPIVLHGLYDPTLFLSTGGVNHHGDGSGDALGAVAGLSVEVYLVFALIAFFLVRGRVPATGRHADARPSPA
jgi:membrane protease YdiL (CAAX protease family)